MKVFLAGPIGDVPHHNLPLFSAVAEAVAYRGHTPIIPHEVCADVPPGSPHADYMRRTIPAMCACDCVLMLPGWGGSRGATREHSVAPWVGVRVVYSVMDLADEGRAA